MSLLPAPSDPCPCGTGKSLGACCQPYLRGTPAPTAEALMRSRFTAFALGDRDHLFRTWHPRTRPADVSTDAAVRWTGLEITATTGGGPDDETGEVSFIARYEGPDGPGELREHSRFARRGARWTYVDGDQLG